MVCDTNETLNSLLCDWHRWAKGYQHVGGINSSPMFQSYCSSRQYDSEHEIVDGGLHADQMKAIEFAINGDGRGEGAMPEPYKTAISFRARNLSTGKSVWNSPRIPTDPLVKAKIIADATKMLIEKLSRAGVM